MRSCGLTVSKPVIKATQGHVSELGKGIAMDDEQKTGAGIRFHGASSMNEPET
jgi:hypothetical protein